MTGRARRQQRKRARRLAVLLRWELADISVFFAPMSTKEVRARLLRRFITGGAYYPFARLEAAVGFDMKSFLLPRSLVPGS